MLLVGLVDDWLCGWLAGFMFPKYFTGWCTDWKAPAGPAANMTKPTDRTAHTNHPINSSTLACQATNDDDYHEAD